MDFDYIAPTELFKVEEFVNDLHELNCVPVAVSPPNLYAKEAWANTPPCEGGVAGVTFRLVEDKGGKIAELYEI